MSFTPLLLAGGKSTRMGSPKHLLPMPDGRPLYQHQLDLLARACPDAPTIYISLAQDSPLDRFLQSLTPSQDPPSPPTSPRPTTAPPAPASAPNPNPNKPSIALLRDARPNPAARSAGPAAGLLAAFRARPAATWLVLAVDYPLLTPGMLRALCAAYAPPVTWW
ncbi:b18cd0c0-f4ad-4005-8551-9f0e2e92d569 [Thermothielavioides terrestris]|uniref:B18cd0c0-f4ad-4005-8551-9f0e2e92d569 n=1 Tax=Thermothielavioides terrestris TaxID=2587410 RepID=A0A446BTM6_9PEZI|nr:b18cd0c0-f4ad-4005-8551-9f0e2e92d569 [Thermothielavioides terrestris]